MTWEEIIIQIRKDPQYAELVEKAYFDADLELNVQRFADSEEFRETLAILKEYSGLETPDLLDIGAGNGISSVAFALKGYRVSAVEPDKSETVGSGAIRWLKNKLHLDNLNVFDSFGENLPFEKEVFDVVYIRQAMHHAADLDKFIAEAARTLKKGGVLLTIRDHVVYDEKDKEWFLNEHPLHRFYGGENAFTEAEYKQAMQHAGLEIKQTLRYYDSPINYFPLSKTELEADSAAYKEGLKTSLRRRLGPLASSGLLLRWYKAFTESRNGMPFDEKHVAGRMYTFVATKAI
ncbi:MAG: class I SAM-dependent methyltransferase [Bacteroidia bacterium]